MILISIIIPVYNAEDHLSKCINSVISQSYANWELFLINDGSTDKSGEICDNYALLDNRINVFHQNNKGVSSARNIGLNKATGEWITFIDSDDYVNKRYLENLISHVDESIDLVISYSEQICNNLSTKENYSSILITPTNLSNMFIENDMHWHTAPWSKLFNNKLIQKNNIRFKEKMHWCEDAVFLFTYMLFCDNIYISSDTDYNYYYDRSGSLTKKTNSLE